MFTADLIARLQIGDRARHFQDPVKVRPLLLARKSDPLTNRGGTFYLRARNIAILYGRHLDMQIDPIQ